MDATESSKGAKTPAKKGIVGRIIRIILVAIIAQGIFFGILIWRNQVATKQKNLEDSVQQELKQSQKIALEAVAADSGAKELLGDDIKDAGGLARDGSGEIDRTGTVLHFDVVGSKQKGRVTAPAAMEKGAWQITGEIEIKAANGKTVKVAKPGEKPPDINLDL
jgi:hypothetical protein